jgi:hypothetical protein
MSELDFRVDKEGYKKSCKTARQSYYSMNKYGNYQSARSPSKFRRSHLNKQMN